MFKRRHFDSDKITSGSAFRIRGRPDREGGHAPRQRGDSLFARTDILWIRNTPPKSRLLKFIVLRLWHRHTKGRARFGGTI